MHRSLLLLPLLAACAQAPFGLRETPQGDGPAVMVDWDASPLPELPFPNDLATKPDPTSPTGLRVNISSEAATTEVEAEARAKIDELSGFGIYMPITVRFDEPLDLDAIADRHGWGIPVDEGAFFVVDVTPGSPTYLEPVDLDVGHGRFPGDVNRTDVYFPNDPQVDVPSILFDTRDEDVNGNGELDPGEDLDGDGWLDVPNLFSPDDDRALTELDPRDDLLTWYERLTNTLIFRPAMPLREETTYAVVLTDRLVGEDGNPVRSPWEYVNHTRQTRALEPLYDGLPALGLSVDDVSFAWTFTTGRITGDLVDLRRAHDGEGPYAWLPGEIEPAILRAHPMHDLNTADNDYLLPASVLTQLLDLGGLVGDDDAVDALAEGYSFAEGIVGGEFRTAFLLADRDDGGDGDWVDEWWQTNPVTGEVSAQPQDVAFTCVIPKEGEGRQQPFDVGIYGHGYGSSRVEGLLFTWALVRQGMAGCVMDFPGHGPDLSPEERDELADTIEGVGLMPFLEHIEQARYQDTDNDGVKDSGSHQWTADAPHTRDMVRQAVVDWMWWIEALKSCGEGTMEAGGEQVVSCDWDGDGTPDLGGPDASFSLAGGSLGGIINGVAAPVLPDVQANLPVVGGAGLLDISTRADTHGAVEGMHGKLMSPMFLGRPQSDGSLLVTQYANSYFDMHELPVGTLPSIPAGGTVRVENLMNGEVREGVIPDGTGPRPAGAFRVAIPADAMDYYERRVATGMPDTGPEEGATYTLPGNDGLGDLLVVTLFDAAGDEVAVLDTFEGDALFQGVTYEAGSPLVAAAPGLGRVRGAPETRRLYMVVSMVVEPGDPAAYAPHYVTEPFEELGGQPTNVLIMPTIGDMVVSVNSEIAMARAAGFIEQHEPDPRYGMPVDQWLVERRVIHGLEEHGPYTDAEGRPALFDPDDLDRGLDHWGAPSDAPLRVTVPTPVGVSGMRIPYVDRRGTHGFRMPDPDLAFDINTFSINQFARYLSTGGQELSDDLCLEDSSCDWIPTEPPEEAR